MTVKNTLIIIDDLKQEWEPTEKELKLWALARRYHDETEAYDRTVCTGPIVKGAIMPASPHEAALIVRHAIVLKKKLILEAGAYEISSDELRKAISNLQR